MNYICDYLNRAGWNLCAQTLFQVDPITGAKYPSDVAYTVQLGRDLFK
jgi:hypothetical protein